MQKHKTAGATFDVVGDPRPLPIKMLIYTLPIVATGILQLLFNAADVIVVGQFSGDAALAAVGSTGSLINLIVNLLAGLSVGASVCAAQAYGAQDDKTLSEVVHTAICVSVIGGVIFGIIGFVGSRTFLTWMGNPDDVIDQATLYLKIYFVGTPVMMLYNFGAAILRSVGDTRHPLVFLSISGAINVVLNLFFVIVLGMDVDGVAYATVISQAIAAVLVVVFLVRSKENFRLELSKLRINKKQFMNMVRIGIPAGLQGSVFSLSNVVIQSSINDFGKVVMAGNTASSNIEGFIYISMNSFYHSALTFTGQNIGAGKPERIRKVMLLSAGMSALTGVILGAVALTFNHSLLSLYCTENPEAIEYGLVRMGVIATTYFFCGIMDSLTGSIRGLGNSVSPMIISMLGACGIRVLWINTAYKWVNYTEKTEKLRMLYLCYPISWILTCIALFVCFIIVKNNIMRRFSEHRASENAEASVK